MRDGVGFHVGRQRASLLENTNTLILRCEREARASKDPMALIQDTLRQYHAPRTSTNHRRLPAHPGLRADVLCGGGRAAPGRQSAVRKDPLSLVACRTGQGASGGLERRRDHPRLPAGRRERGRHGLRLRRRQPRHLRRPRHFRLAPKTRPAGRNHRRHLGRALRAGQGRPARLPPRHAPLGACGRLPRSLPRGGRRAVAVRPRRRSHHLLGGRLGARHDGGADRSRSRPRPRRCGGGMVPAHPHPRRHGAAADGPPPSPRYQRRKPARGAPRHGGEPRVAEAAQRPRLSRRRLASTARTAVPEPARPQHPRPLSGAPSRPRPPAPPRDVAPHSRRGDRHRLRLRQPVCPRLLPRLWRGGPPAAAAGGAGGGRRRAGIGGWRRRRAD
jgi:hypothetical protein